MTELVVNRGRSRRSHSEPQNMATPLRKRAIATLNPLIALRYSATHRELFNLVHRLSAKKASELGLVKRVAVKGVVAGSNGQPYLSLRKIVSKGKNPAQTPSI